VAWGEVALFVGVGGGCGLAVASVSSKTFSSCPCPWLPYSSALARLLDKRSEKRRNRVRLCPLLAAYGCFFFATEVLLFVSVGLWFSTSRAADSRRLYRQNQPTNQPKKTMYPVHKTHDQPNQADPANQADSAPPPRRHRAAETEGPPQFLTVNNYARRIDCSARNLYRLVASGVVPSIKLGYKTVRIPVELADASLKRLTTGGTLEAKFPPSEAV
jgi:hypothetical protein